MTASYQKLLVTATSTPLWSEQGDRYDKETELLFGEELSLIDETGEYFQVTTDSYSSPGYVRKDAVRTLARGRSATYTHRVAVVEAPVYERASFKAPDPQGRSLQLNARVRFTAGSSTPEGGMVFVEGLGWIFSDQLIRRDEYMADYVSTAIMFVGRSYNWGGLDCSRLTEQVCKAAGIPCLRNAGEQSTNLGVQVDMKAVDFRFQRGDFVFWTAEKKSRHVVIMVDDHACVHASIAPPRRVVVQSLSTVIARQRTDGNGEPNIVRRFPNRH